MAIHSSILAWRIPWTEQPGGLQSIGLPRVIHDGSVLAHTHVCSASPSRPALGGLGPAGSRSQESELRFQDALWGARCQESGTDQTGCGRWACSQSKAAQDRTDIS